MRNIDLYILQKGLNSCPGDPVYEDPERKKNRLDFLCLVSKNKIAVQLAVDVLNDISKESDDFVLFKREREATLMKFALKDESGRPMFTESPNRELSEAQGRPIMNRVYKLSQKKEDEEKFNKEIEKLNNKFKEAIDKQDANTVEFNSYLRQPVKDKTEKTFDKISKTILPDNLSQTAMDGLVFILK